MSIITHKLRPWPNHEGKRPTLCLLWNPDPATIFEEPSCETCAEMAKCCGCIESNFGQSMAPSHFAMKSCRSGKRPHCTCDTCF